MSAPVPPDPTRPTQAQAEAPYAGPHGDAPGRAGEAPGHGEELFRSAFEDTDVAMALADAGHRFVRINAAFARLFGYAAEEMLGLSAADVTHPEDLAQSLARRRPLESGGAGSFRAEERYLRKGGGVFWGVANVSLVLDAQGRPLLFVCQVRDVTERRRAEDASARYVERLRILNQIDRALIAGESPAQIAAAALVPLRELLGVPRAVVNLFDLQKGEVEWLAAAGRKRVRATPGVRYSIAFMGDVEALRRGEPQSIDVLALPPGQEADALLASGVRAYAVVPMIAGGELIGAISFGGESLPSSDEQFAVAREAAAQFALALAQARLHERVRRQGERLGLLWEAASVLLTSDEPNAMLRRLFDRIASHLGLDVYLNYLVDESGSSLRLASWAGVTDEVARSVERLQFGQAVCGTVAQQRLPAVASFVQSSDDPKVQLVRSLGVRAYACNPLTAAGRLFGTLSFASRSRDQFADDELEFLATVSHHVAAAYERLRLVGVLREEARRKDALAMLAHELRNPLATLTPALAALRQGISDPQQRGRSVELMERQTRHLRRLVDDLLEASQFAHGKVRLLAERLDLARLAKTAAEDRRPALGQAGLALEVQAPPTPVWVNGDAVRLTQAVGNLLDNAARYGRPGGRVTLSVWAEAAEGRAVLAVADTGVGIDPQVLPRLFRPFEQADQGLARSGGGLGLGLSVVRSVAQLHGGTAEAHSDGPGHGATFTVLLPLEPEPGALCEKQDVPAAGPGRHRILVVEDNADAADSLRTLLEVLGHEVRVAHSGPDGVQAAAEWLPDVVVSDVGLPGFDGWEVARRVPLLPGMEAALLVALTGYGSEDDKRRSREAGFHRHLVKPAEPAELRLALAPIA